MGWSDELAAAAPASAPASWADELAASKAAPAAKAPSFLDQLGYSAQAFGHHLVGPLHGAAQFVENSLAAGANKLPDNPVSRYLVKTAHDDNAAMTERERAYQAAVPDGWGANTGAVAGTVAPFVIGAVPNGLRSLGDSVASRMFPTAAGQAPSIVARAVSGATQGAAVGAAQPVVQPETTLSDLVTGNTPADPGYWSQKGQQVTSGAAWGGVLPILSGAANGAWQSGKSAISNSALLNPKGYAAKNLAAQLGADAPAVADRLANAPQYVPGSVPSSAQAGASPDLVMMEKALLNNHAPFAKSFLNQQNANNAARLQAVGNVAQTPEALQAAVDARTAVTAPMRDFTVTNGNPVPVQGVTGSLSSLADGALGVRPTIGGAANNMRSAVDEFTNVTPPNTLMNTPGSATANPAMLDALRQNANDYLANFAPNGVVGTQEQAAMAPVKSAIIDAINEANPGHKLNQGGWGKGLEQSGPQAPSYRDYLTEFAKRSVPVNTMELGQQLQSKLASGSMNSAGEAQATFGGYRSALAQSLRKSDYAIDPQAQAALEAVQNDLQRATISNSVKMGGSDTAFNKGAGESFLRAFGAGGSDTGKMVTAGTAAGALTGSPQAAAGAAFAAKKAGGFVTNRVADSLGELLLDPQKLAKALQQAGQPQSATVPALLTGFKGKLTPAMAAALALELQKQQAPSVVQRAPENAYQQ